MSDYSFHPNDVSTLTWGDIQLSQIYSSVFGILCFWGAQNVYSSIQGYRKNQKLIYLLNSFQCIFLLIKTISATVYQTYLDLDCSPRGALVNIPLVLAWDLIFAIILLKLLIFTPYPTAVIGFFIIGSLCHLSLVIAGVVMRVSSVSLNGICRDVYPPLYKGQYAIEAAIEIFSVLTLIHGIAHKERGGIFSTTTAIFNQLRSNENLRVFSVLFFITLKLAITYSNPPFPTSALTHTIDSCRSALVCWAVLREQSSVLKAVTKTKLASTRGIQSTGKGSKCNEELSIIKETAELESILVSNESALHNITEETSNIDVNGFKSQDTITKN